MSSDITLSERFFLGGLESRGHVIPDPDSQGQVDAWRAVHPNPEGELWPSAEPEREPEAGS